MAFDVQKQINMSYATEHIASTLKAAREAKGLSQRDLSARAGVPQSHISKIESGAVDLRLSSLIALARVLDLELELVPRKTVPAVQSIIRSGEPKPVDDSPRVRSVLKEIRNVAEFAIKSSGEALSDEDASALRRNLLLLSQFRLSEEHLTTIKSAMRAMKVYLDHPENKGAVRDAASMIGDLRNHLLHNSAGAAIMRPAYSLAEDDDA